MSSGLQFAGEYNVEDITLYTPEGQSVFLQSFLVELNIYEDLFSNFLTGNMVLSDSGNLIGELPIKGVETLSVRINTPTMDDPIEKTFRVYSVTDRLFVRDQNTQVYKLNFCSQEGFLDGAKSLFKSYKGKVSSIVQQIYDDELKVTADLEILTQTENEVKFVANGWSPYKVINWLSGKGIPSGGKAPSFLFWETVKKAYFGTPETLIKNKKQNMQGEFVYSPAGTKDTGDTNTKMFRIEELNIVRTSDYLANHLSGYLANRFITIDPIKKQYEVTDYDHVDKWQDYTHIADTPLFSKDTQRNFDNARTVYPRHPELFTSVKDNLNEKMKDIFGPRVSLLNEANNFKMNIVVAGRTNMEVGHTLKLLFPDASPTDESDRTSGKKDPLYSGEYLITAVRHKFNPTNHACILEVMRDSVGTK